MAGRLLLVSMALNSAVARLPSLEYAYTSFATPAPVEASAFLVKYFGAVALEAEDYVTHHESGANVSGVRFSYGSSNSSHDVYFVDDPASPGPRELMSYFHETHRFDLEEHWDWFMDWHLCFNVDDMDVAAARLLADGVPLVTRSSSFYVEIPDGITVQFLSSGVGGELVWTEAFNFCRKTGEESLRSAVQDMQLHELPTPLPPMPEIRPGHHSFFSSQPTAGRDAVVALGADIYNTSGVFQSTHRYGDGTCALLEWLQLPSFQIHFVDQYHKYQGDGLSVEQIEDKLEAAHGDMSSYDAFMNNRVGFRVDSLEPFRASLDAHHLAYLEHGPGALLVQIPGGIIVELLAA